MINPQLIDYIRQQFAIGISKEEISKALVTNGWQVADINDAFASVAGPTPVFQSAAPTLGTQMPVQNSIQPVAWSHKGMMAIVIILLLLVGAGGAFAAYHYNLFVSPSVFGGTHLASTTLGDLSTTTGSIENAVSSEVIPSSNNRDLLNMGTSTGTVIGYIWMSGPNGPRFSTMSMSATRFSDTGTQKASYDVSIWDGNSFVFYQKITDSAKLTFPKGGVSEFKISGIDSSLGICATDHAFIFQMGFTQDGLFKGTKIPITNDIPNETCAARNTAALQAAANTPQLATMPPSGLLLPTTTSIPKNFSQDAHFNLTDEYAYGYKDWTDQNSNGNPASITISESKETETSNYKLMLSYLVSLHSSKGMVGKDFIYNAMQGYVSETTVYPGNIDHMLILKDGDHFLKIETRDGLKTRFSLDGLINLLKTFTRQP